MFKILFSIILLVFSFFIYSNFLISKVNAQELLDCFGIRTDPSQLFSDPSTTPRAKFIVNVGKNDGYSTWKMEFECGAEPLRKRPTAQLEGNPGDPEIYTEIPNDSCEFHAGNHTIKVIAVANGDDTPQCRASYKVTASRTQCKLDIDPKTGITSATNLTVSGSNLIAGERYALFIDDNDRITGNAVDPGLVPTTGGPEGTGFSGIAIPNRYLTPKPHKLSLRIWRGPSLPVPGVTAPGHNYGPPLCILPFEVGTPSRPGGIIGPGTITGRGPVVTAGGDPCDGDKGIKTAIGCIHTDPAGFVKDFLSFAVGISGGLAFLMMLLGAFQMLTSAGNPETLQAGRDRFSSAIIGLLIVVLAVLLLKIIGIDILGIPGFTA